MNRILLSLGAVLGAAMPLVFDSALKGAALLLLAALCTLGMRRGSASARHLVWLVAVAALLVVPLLSGYLPQWRVLPGWAVAPVISMQPPAAPASPTVTTVTAREWDPVRPPAPLVREMEAPRPNGVRESVAAAPALEVPRKPAETPEQPWRWWLPVGWMAGFVLCCLRLLTAHWLLRRVERGCEEVVDGPLAAALEKARAHLGIRQTVRLLVDPRRTIPLVWGVFRPRLVLPLEAAAWDERQLRSVLLHEMAHIRRKDTAVQWLTQIVCALHWFNPLVWFAAWRLHAERERACDDLVLASGVRASEYAAHLLHVATKLRSAGWSNVCGLAMARPSRLEGRLLAVLSERLDRRRVTAALVVAALMLGAGIAIPLAMLRAAEEEAWNPPQAAHVATNGRSTYCVHDGTQSAFVLHTSGMSGSRTESSNNPKTRTWTDSGALTLDNGKVFNFLRNHTSPETLTVNGRNYELANGRVFELTSEGAIRQIPMNAPPIRDQPSLEQFDRRLKATLAAMPPQVRENIEEGTAPKILAVQFEKQRLQMVVSKEMGALIFRVGESTVGQRFSCFLEPADAARTLSLDLEPDGLGVSWWERLRIIRGDHMPGKLPILPPAWLPEGKWVWRESATFKNGKVEFADVIRPDSPPLPVSVAGAKLETNGQTPSIRSVADVEATFQIYAMKEGAPASMQKLSKAEFEQWRTGAGKPLLEPRVSTRSGNRAVIEIIREYRHTVPSGEWVADNLGLTCEIDAVALFDGVRATGNVRMAFLDGKYASVKAALDGQGELVKSAAPGTKVQRFDANYAGDLKSDEALIVPLDSKGLLPETAVAVVLARTTPVRPWPRWRPGGEREPGVEIRTFGLTVPPGAFADLRKALLEADIHSLESPLWHSENAGERIVAAVSREQFAAVSQLAAKGMLSLEGKPSVMADPEHAVEVVGPNGKFEIKAALSDLDGVPSAADLSMTGELPGADGTQNRRWVTNMTVFRNSRWVLWDRAKAGEPTRATILYVAPEDAPAPSGEQPPIFIGTQSAPPLQSVETKGDSAQITVERGEGSLAWIVGEGAQARMMVHAFGASAMPISFHISADDRQGHWWNEVRITREGEGTSLLPVLPNDWLPHGRVVFVAQPAKAADGSYRIAEIESASGRVPIFVRQATPAEAERGALRSIPRTFSEMEIVVDARVHALAAKAPAKAILLPVMAAEDLVGSPRSALAWPYEVLKPGLAARFGETSEVGAGLRATATLLKTGVHVEGEIHVGLGAATYPSAAEAWKRAGLEAREQIEVKVPISATLGGNDALVVPIDVKGAFPETLVVSLTAHPRRVERPTWLPPEARPAIQVDGWVLTWPAAEQEWFAKQFDYEGLPGMIQHLVQKRKEKPQNVNWTESVGTLKPAEVDKLVAQFRQHPGVSVQRVEPFTAGQGRPPVLMPGDRVSFLAAGEPATVQMSTDERTISPNLVWTKPVLPHISGSSGYAIYSGTSLCSLLPGPADPAEIRMLVLRCVDPSRETETSPKAAKPHEQPTPKLKEEPKPKSAEAQPLPEPPRIATRPGQWQFADGLTLEIASKPVQADGRSVIATLHWPARADRPAVKHEFSVATAALADRANWAVGWIPGTPSLWIVAEEPGNSSSIREIRYEKPEQIFENSLSRHIGEPIAGLEMPKELVREFEKHFTITPPEPGIIALPRGPYAGGQQQFAAKTEGVWTIEGTVTDVTGQPKEGVIVRVNCEHYPLLKLDDARTDAAGHYRVALRLGLETLAAFRGVQVVPLLKGFAERDLAKTGEFNAVLQAGEKVEHPFSDRELVIGQPGRADFVMMPASVIAGKIVDPNGRPLAKRYVAAVTPGQRRGYSIASTTTDSGGAFRLEGIPGNLPVFIHTAEYEKPSQSGSSEPRTFESGKTHPVTVTVKKEADDRETVKIAVDAEKGPEAPPQGAAAEPPKKQAWSATGRVTDAEGRPMEGVEIWVHAGMGTLFRTGLTKTDADGNYTAEFGPGGLSSKNSPNTQVAQITAYRAGYFEKNLNRQGNGAVGSPGTELEFAL